MQKVAAVAAITMAAGSALQYTVRSLKNNKKFMLAAVSKNGQALMHASDALKNDQEVVLAAVSQDGWALYYVSDALKNNKEFLIRLSCDAFLKNKFFFSQVASVKLITEELKQEIYQKLVHDHAERLSPCPLCEHLTTELLDCKNEELKNFLIYTFIHTSEEQLITALQSKEFTDSQKNDVITCLLVIRSLPESDKLKSRLIFSLKSHYKNLFKDTLKRQILLQLFQSIEKIDAPNKYALIASMMEKNKGNELMNCLHMLKALAAFAPQKWYSLQEEHLTPSHLAKLLLGDLQACKMIPEGDDSLMQAASTFLTYRKPGAFLSYASRFTRDATMCKALLQFTTGVINGTFQQARNQANSHNEYLTKEQKALWQAPLAQQSASRAASTAPFDIKGFLHQKLVEDKHGGELLAPIIPYLRKEVADTSSFTNLQKRVIALITTDQEHLPQALQELNHELEDPQYNGLEFKNDVRAALVQLQGTKGTIKATLIDSDDAEDFLLCGTEVTGSCQRVDGDPILNKCLMGYALDGKVRLLAVKNSRGTILARAILKILIDDKNQPVLFFERVYGDPNYKQALASFAAKKAHTTGMPLFEAGDGCTLRSFGNAAPFEYEDGGVGVSNGTYELKAKLKLY